MKSEMIQEKLMVGIRDENPSQQLQKDPKLTLDKTKKKIRQKEAVHHQHNILKGRDTHPSSDLEGIKYKSKHATAYLARQKNVHAVVKQNIHVVNAQRETLNVLNAIRRGTIAVCVCKTTAVTTVQGTEQQMPQKLKAMTISWEL